MWRSFCCPEFTTQMKNELKSSLSLPRLRTKWWIRLLGKNLLPRICYPHEFGERIEEQVCQNELLNSRPRNCVSFCILGMEGEQIKLPAQYFIYLIIFILLGICVFFWLFILFLWVIYLDINIEIFYINYLINIIKGNYKVQFNSSHLLSVGRGL